MIYGLRWRPPSNGFRVCRQASRFTVAVRRAVRSGDADGTLIEDVGIPGQPYEMTRDDLFCSNRDLIEQCGQLLASQPFTRLNVRQNGRTVMADTVGLDHLDLYVNGHPAAPPLMLRNQRMTTRIPMPAHARHVEIVGFATGVLRQRRRLTLLVPRARP